MPGPYHAVVWINHRLARIFRFNAEDPAKTVVHAEHPIREIRRGQERLEAPLAKDKVFLEEVTGAVADAEAILVVGPGVEKHDFVAHIERIHPDMLVKIEGSEAAEHPAEGEFIAHARRLVGAPGAK